MMNTEPMPMDEWQYVLNGRFKNMISDGIDTPTFRPVIRKWVELFIKRSPYEIDSTMRFVRTASIQTGKRDLVFIYVDQNDRVRMNW